MKSVLFPLLLALVFALGCTDKKDPVGPDFPEEDTASQDTENTEPQFRLQFEEVPLSNEPKRITEFQFLPGTSEVLLAEQKGALHHMLVEEDGWTALGSIDLPDIFLELDCGVLSITFDPDFENNGYFYVGHCQSKTHSRITRFTFDADNFDAVGDSAVEILTLGDSNSGKPWHNIGSMGFDDTGALWALFGEKTIKANSQDLANNLGAMIRIRPGADGGYTSVDDNPSFDDPNASPDIFAYGLRSPWKGCQDNLGRTWVGDVGSGDFEEVNLIPAEGGTNHGWSTHEGPCTDNCEGFTDPILYWDREFEHPFALDDPELAPAEPRVVWIGVQYQDQGEDRYEGMLTDHVLYGDMCLGFIRAAMADETGQVVSDGHIGHLEGISAMVQGPDGYLYSATYGNCESNTSVGPGQIWRAKPLWD